MICFKVLIALSCVATSLCLTSKVAYNELTSEALVWSCICLVDSHWVTVLIHCLGQTCLSLTVLIRLKLTSCCKGMDILWLKICRKDDNIWKSVPSESIRSAETFNCITDNQLWHIYHQIDIKWTIKIVQ